MCVRMKNNESIFLSDLWTKAFYWRKKKRSFIVTRLKQISLSTWDSCCTNTSLNATVQLQTHYKALFVYQTFKMECTTRGGGGQPHFGCCVWVLFGDCPLLLRDESHAVKFHYSVLSTIMAKSLLYVRDECSVMPSQRHSGGTECDRLDKKNFWSHFRPIINVSLYWCLFFLWFQAVNILLVCLPALSWITWIILSLPIMNKLVMCVFIYAVFGVTVQSAVSISSTCNCKKKTKCQIHVDDAVKGCLSVARKRWSSCVWWCHCDAIVYRSAAAAAFLFALLPSYWQYWGPECIRTGVQWQYLFLVDVHICTLYVCVCVCVCLEWRSTVWFHLTSNMSPSF